MRNELGPWHSSLYMVPLQGATIPGKTPFVKRNVVTSFKRSGKGGVAKPGEAPRNLGAFRLLYAVPKGPLPLAIDLLANLDSRQRDDFVGLIERSIGVVGRAIVRLLVRRRVRVACANLCVDSIALNVCG